MLQSPDYTQADDQYDAADALVSSTTYSRDRLGNITAQTDSGGTTTCTLDPLYRLTQADYPGTAFDELFSYDKVGNRLTYTKGSLTPNASTRHYTYTPGTNRLAEIRIGSTTGTLESSFNNDFEGRLTSQTGIGAKTLTWDAKGRLITVGAETYTYDPMDYRIGRSGGSMGNLDYFLEGEHLESVEIGGALVERYFRGAGTDELVAAWRHLRRSPVAATDAPDGEGQGAWIKPITGIKWVELNLHRLKKNRRQLERSHRRNERWPRS